MNKIGTRGVAALIVALLIGAGAFAQDRRASSIVSDLYLISAKAGGVNFLEGAVTVARKDGRSSVLLRKDSLEEGDEVETSSDGRAEILLNPGSFARLAENSRFSMLTTSLDDLKLRLTRGSAIFEVYAGNDFNVTVETPNTKFLLLESGVYRIDVLDKQTSRIEVNRGRAQLSDSSATIVKAKHAANLNGKEITLEKFDRGDKDAFETWSELRGKEAVKANSRLREKTLTNSLLASRNSWNIYNTFGVWAFEPRFGFCFVPFGYGWYSPYGYWYRNDYWSLPLPPIIYRQPRGTPVGGSNGNGSGSGSGTGGTVQPEPRRSPKLPPFERFPQAEPPRREPGPTFEPRSLPPAQSPPIVVVPSSGSRKEKDE
jgi:hypothetical protein